MIVPQTLNEKILFLSLKTDTSQWTRLADKYAVRGYVQECGLENILVKLYAHWTDEGCVQWDTLPKSFVIKSVQGSGDLIFVRDKSKENMSQIEKQMQPMFKERYGALEGGSHYLRINPSVIVEELLPLPEGDTSLIDYKIWCFNGKPAFIWMCRNRDDHGTDVMTYDLNWNAKPEYSIFNSSYRKDKILPPPENLSEMISVAGKLAKPFPVVRVDLYNINGKIIFGEMTFTSLGGLMDFYTDDFQHMAGSMIDLNYKG